MDFYPDFELSKFLQELDVVVIAVSLTDLENTIQSLPVDALRGKLVVDTCALNAHPKSVMLKYFGTIPEIDIVTSHPMITAQAGGDDPYASTAWDGRPMVYEKVRVSDLYRCENFLKIFEEARCQMVEMESEEHDSSIADAEFVTHLTGRLLKNKELLPPTPVLSKEYAALCDVADMTSADSFDLFFGMYKYNERARNHLTKLRDSLSTLERQLAAKEAYLAASSEIRNSDRQRLVAETKMLLREIAASGNLWDSSSGGGGTEPAQNQQEKAKVSVAASSSSRVVESSEPATTAASPPKDSGDSNKRSKQ